MNEKQFLNNGEYICAYCLNKNEDKLCDDYSQCCDKMNKLKNAYSDYLEKQFEQLQQENQQLKEQLLEQTRENYKLKDELNKKTKEYQETYKDVRIEIKDYKNQLKQRDEVIGEAIEFINHTQYDPELRSHVCGINFGGTMKLLEILQRYRDDNK